MITMTDRELYSAKAKGRLTGELAPRPAPAPPEPEDTRISDLLATISRQQAQIEALLARPVATPAAPTVNVAAPEVTVAAPTVNVPASPPRLKVKTFTVNRSNNGVIVSVTPVYE